MRRVLAAIFLVLLLVGCGKKEIAPGRVMVQGKLYPSELYLPSGMDAVVYYFTHTGELVASSPCAFQCDDTWCDKETSVKYTSGLNADRMSEPYSQWNKLEPGEYRASVVIYDSPARFGGKAIKSQTVEFIIKPGKDTVVEIDIFDIPYFP